MQLVTVALYPEAGLLAVVPPSWQADLLGGEAGSPRLDIRAQLGSEGPYLATPHTQGCVCSLSETGAGPAAQS